MNPKEAAASSAGVGPWDWVLSPWTTVPLAVGLLLVAGALVRKWPSLRPLVRPFAAFVLAALALDLVGFRTLPTAGWLALLVLAPMLVFVVRIAGMALQAAFRSHQGYAAPVLLESVMAVALYGVGATFIAHRWFGVDLTPFLATSAVLGAVVGLALQDTLGNLFAGISIHTEEPFRVGDWVSMGDSEGRVEQMSWRAVRLRTWYGDTVTVPNNEAARHAIKNFTAPREPHSRLLFIGVSYRTPPNRVLAVLGDITEQVDLVLKVPAPLFRVVSYGDFAIQYEIRYFVARYDDYRAAEGEINRLIWYHFRRHGIEIPFPIRDVYLHQPAEQPVREESASVRLERALRGIDLFVPLTDDERRAAAASFSQLHYAAGERIIGEGEPGDSFFVVDRGEVEVSKKLGGKDRPLARLMSGQFFGEMALLTGETRSATVVAAADVDVFRLDKAGFQKIIAGNPSIAVGISEILAERRDAQSQAAGDITARLYENDAPADLKQHILKRIRSYFAL
jgi:small-conductance mechanosensitive channel/CRP-like cAMP-binding protein